VSKMVRRQRLYWNPLKDTKLSSQEYCSVISRLRGQRAGVVKGRKTKVKKKGGNRGVHGRLCFGAQKGSRAQKNGGSKGAVAPGVIRGAGIPEDTSSLPTEQILLGNQKELRKEGIEEQHAFHTLEGVKEREAKISLTNVGQKGEKRANLWGR